MFVIKSDKSTTHHGEIVREEEEDRSVISLYIADVKSLSKMFNKCCFNKISRNGNGVAHAISKEGLNRKELAYLEGRALESTTAAVEKDDRSLDLT
ncbi:hypothetical protein Gotri_004408 [Gossypium trilobum]|uniref:RNase H type-1 domain-containing protein n=1 Tax=Gossypium trilobum TaxID=34281 RepID=A0A7J9F4T2_9ROSI|nr:hypothetical protein [Gossypium trilobum]